MRRSTAVLCAGVMRLSAASGNLSAGCLNDFFVCANAVEMDVGFDLGAAASRLSYPVFFSLAAADKAPTRPSAHTWTMCVAHALCWFVPLCGCACIRRSGAGSLPSVVIPALWRMGSTVTAAVAIFTMLHIT